MVQMKSVGDVWDADKVLLVLCNNRGDATIGQLHILADLSVEQQKKKRKSLFVFNFFPSTQQTHSFFHSSLPHLPHQPHPNIHQGKDSTTWKIWMTSS